MTYLYLKAFHIIFFTSWFAGLFYLPRIFVNLAMVDSKPETYQHLLIMARKLYRFVTPFMYITIGLGVAMLWFNPGLLKSGWMHAKLALVVLLMGYHFVCGYYLNRFINTQSTRGHVYYRWFNEFPVIILLVVVILAITKPF